METKKKDDREKGKGKEEGKVLAFKITKDKIRNQVSFMKRWKDEVQTKEADVVGHASIPPPPQEAEAENAS